MNLGIWGLILDIIGVFIITITEIKNPHFGKIFGQPLMKTYWWNGRRPLYKNTETKKWIWKWNHKPVVFGMLPPKYKLEFLGLLIISIGFILQLMFYLN
jgi:hypothetical protein